MKKSIILFFIISYIFPIELNDYECNISKLSNISSNRALTTLKALGYYTIEHENVYVEEEFTNNLKPNEFDLDESLNIVEIINRCYPISDLSNNINFDNNSIVLELVDKSKFDLNQSSTKCSRLKLEYKEALFLENSLLYLIYFL